LIWAAKIRQEKLCVKGQKKAKKNKGGKKGETWNRRGKGGEL